MTLTFSTATLYGFLLVLARVAGVFAFGALPMSRSVPAVARIVLALAVTMLLAPFWPSVPSRWDDPAVESWRLSGRLAGEAALGSAMGLVVALLGECFLLAAQIFGLQAGYSYASTIDPNSEADSGVLLVFAQLASWLFFLAIGLDRLVIRALARSLELTPAGSFWFTPESRAAVLELGGHMFSTALRLALPIVAMLLLVDIAFAVFGKLHAQLQLLALAFPVKMLAAIALLAAGVRTFPGVYEPLAGRAVAALYSLAGS
jgi:flagellar biosynthetic protein FliR